MGLEEEAGAGEGSLGEAEGAGLFEEEGGGEGAGGEGLEEEFLGEVELGLSAGVGGEGGGVRRE